METVDNYMLRHKVIPGITGLAQVNGCRGETKTREDMQRRVNFDLYYIQRWNFWLDLQIMKWSCIMMITLCPKESLLGQHGIITLMIIF